MSGSAEVEIEVDRSASFSRDRGYRYTLARRWAEGPSLTWVMLNPSTAGAVEDDPTIRRCIGFARAWGYAGIEVVNLFALRSTEPRALVESGDPVGPRAGVEMRRSLREADAVVAAWGNLPPALAVRAEEVRAWLPPSTFCLGRTAAGQPRHPLYVRGDIRPVPLHSLTLIEARPTMSA